MSEPSTSEKVVSFFKSLYNWGKSGFALVTEAQYLERLGICDTCDKVAKDDEGLPLKCKECGCYLDMKAGMRTSECPLNKWPNVS